MQQRSCLQRLRLVVGSALVALGALACAQRSAVPLQSAGLPAAFRCGLLSVPFAPAVPGDAPILSNQNDADCFAWWEFIALNWPASGGFGDPGDFAPVQWETYMPKELLFRSGARPPPAWGRQPDIPPDCGAQAALAAGDPAAHRRLRAVSKVSTAFATEFSFPADVREAAPFNAPNWLGAQNGTNVWYEIRVNRDEYEYIRAMDHNFYNAQRQADWVAGNQPIVLPKGSSAAGGPTGAIELKAAWMEVPDPGEARWRRYKLGAAVVVDPASGQCRRTAMALVGLHILHKTESQPTWIWATFEHVDNVPGAGSGPWNFYSESCQPRKLTVPASCLAPGQSSPVTVGCTPNTPPPYALGPGCPGPLPIQVTRSVPLDSAAQQVNQTVQQAIAAAYPDSVWQYYQLVNTIWSTSPTQDPTAPVNVNPNVNPSGMPLTGMQPLIKVANTTLETYAQTLTCTDCHRYATIAPTPTAPQPPWDSDFSFALGSASVPASR